MGAGRGNTQRIRSAQTPPTSIEKAIEACDVFCAPTTWDKWVRSMNLNKVLLWNYYLSQAPQGRKLSDQEKAFIITEIFRDAVDNKAIELTENLDLEKFHFGAHSRGRSYVDMSVEYIENGKSVAKGKARAYTWEFAALKKMSGTTSLLKEVWHCVSNLVD